MRIPSNHCPRTLGRYTLSHPHTRHTEPSNPGGTLPFQEVSRFFLLMLCPVRTSTAAPPRGATVYQEEALLDDVGLRLTSGRVFGLALVLHERPSVGIIRHKREVQKDRTPNLPISQAGHGRTDLGLLRDRHEAREFLKPTLDHQSNISLGPSPDRRTRDTAVVPPLLARSDPGACARVSALCRAGPRSGRAAGSAKGGRPGV